MPYEGWLPTCAICNQSVDLTESKTDEHGRPVHESCYVSQLIGKKRRGLTMRVDAAQADACFPSEL